MLSHGANNVVIALSDNEVGKLFEEGNRAELIREAELMQFANSVNDLVVRFLRMEQHRESGNDMLVMQRLYPIDFRAYEIERRQLWLDVFEHELKQLHQAGFVHRDLIRMAERPGLKYDNILLTASGLRLIDVGISTMRGQVEERLFRLMVKKELEELEQFKSFFLNR